MQIVSSETFFKQAFFYLFNYGGLGSARPCRGRGKKKVVALVDVCEIVPVSECSVQNVQLRLVSLALRFYAVTKAVPGLRFKATLFKFCTSSYGLFTLRYGQRGQSCPGRDIPASVARTRTADGPGASPPLRVRAGKPHKHLSHRLVRYITAYSPAKARHLPKPPSGRTHF